MEEKNKIQMVKVENGIGLGFSIAIGMACTQLTPIAIILLLIYG